MAAKADMNNCVIYFGIGGCVSRTISIVDIYETDDIDNDKRHNEILEYLNNLYQIKSLQYFPHNTKAVTTYIDCATTAKCCHAVEIAGSKHEIYLIKSPIKDIVSGINTNNVTITLHKFPKPKRTPKPKAEGDTATKSGDKPKRGRQPTKNTESTEAEGETVKPIQVDDPIDKNKNKNKKEKENETEDKKKTDKKKETPPKKDDSSDESSSDSSDSSDEE